MNHVCVDILVWRLDDLQEAQQINAIMDDFTVLCMYLNKVCLLSTYTFTKQTLTWYFFGDPSLGEFSEPNLKQIKYIKR